MIKYGTKSKLKSLKKLIRHLHIARSNIAVVDLSGKDSHTFIQDVILPAFKNITLVSATDKPKYVKHKKAKRVPADNLCSIHKGAESVVIDNVLEPEIIKYIAKDEDSVCFCRSYVVTYKAKSIDDFISNVGDCLGDDTYVKYKDYCNYRGDNVFDLIVTIDDISFGEETEPPRYEVVGVHILRWNDYTEEEELIHAIWLNRSNNKYYCCEFPSRNDMQARYRVSDNTNRELLLDSFKKLFLNFEERN